MLALGIVLGGCRTETELRRYEYAEVHMGTSTRIVLYAPSDSVAERAARAAYARIAELEQVLSDYRVDSEVRRLCAQAGGAAVPVSDDLAFVLRRALILARETEGAFDVTVAPVVALWREARQTGRLPDSAALHAARARVGWRLVELDPPEGTARLARPGMCLDFGGIGKGYAADEALRVLRAHEVDRALIELGGEVVAGRAPPGEDAWEIAVADADPAHRVLHLTNAAVASSGDTEQFVEIGGTRYSHVVDPRTGLGLTHRASATVVARTGMMADAYATALTVLDPPARARFLAAHPEATVYLRAVEP